MKTDKVVRGTVQRFKDARGRVYFRARITFPDGERLWLKPRFDREERAREYADEKSREAENRGLDRRESRSSGEGRDLRPVLRSPLRPQEDDGQGRERSPGRVQVQNVDQRPDRAPGHHRPSRGARRGDRGAARRSERRRPRLCEAQRPAGHALIDALVRTDLVEVAAVLDEDRVQVADDSPPAVGESRCAGLGARPRSSSIQCGIGREGSRTPSRRAVRTRVQAAIGSRGRTGRRSRTPRHIGAPGPIVPDARVPAAAACW
jgi:hypothetical protein